MSQKPTPNTAFGLSDAVVVAGAISLNYGLWLIHPIAFFVGLGLELIYTGAKLGRTD